MHVTERNRSHLRVGDFSSPLLEADGAGGQQVSKDTGRNGPVGQLGWMHFTLGSEGRVLLKCTWNE